MRRKIVVLPALFIIVSAFAAIAAPQAVYPQQDMAMVESIDGYQVKMTVLNSNPPVVGANQVIFELADSSGNIVADIADIGVTYEMSGFMPRRIMPVSNTGDSYTGVLNIYKAASYDVFFVFTRRGENQRVVRFTFQTNDNTPQQNN